MPDAVDVVQPVFVAGDLASATRYAHERMTRVRVITHDEATHQLRGQPGGTLIVLPTYSGDIDKLLVLARTRNMRIVIEPVPDVDLQR